jgi:hypothetical protein
MTVGSFAPILETARTRLGAAALEALLADRRLIRHWGKLSVNRNFNGLGGKNLAFVFEHRGNDVH